MNVTLCTCGVSGVCCERRIAFDYWRSVRIRFAKRNCAQQGKVSLR